MAVTAFGMGFILGAQGDKLDNATLGHPGDTGSYRLLVNQISLIADATGGATVIKAGGQIIYSGTPTVSATTIITAFGDAQELDNVEASTLPASNHVQVVVLVGSH